MSSIINKSISWWPNKYYVLFFIRARDAAQEEKNRLVVAATILGATSSQKLKNEADVISDLIRKVDTRIDNIERIMASIDYSIKRFQEVDAACANRIKNSQINDIRNQKSQILCTNVGIFSSSFINDGSKIWKSFGDDKIKGYDWVESLAFQKASNGENKIKGSANVALASNIFLKMGFYSKKKGGYIISSSSDVIPMSIISTAIFGGLVKKVASKVYKSSTYLMKESGVNVIKFLPKGCFDVIKPFKKIGKVTSCTVMAVTGFMDIANT